jgi:hypothetical protein
MRSVVSRPNLPGEGESTYGRAVELMKGPEFPTAVAGRAHEEARQLMGLKELKK